MLVTWASLLSYSKWSPSPMNPASRTCSLGSGAFFSGCCRGRCQLSPWRQQPPLCYPFFEAAIRSPRCGHDDLSKEWISLFLFGEHPFVGPSVAFKTPSLTIQLLGIVHKASPLAVAASSLTSLYLVHSEFRLSTTSPLLGKGRLFIHYHCETLRVFLFFVFTGVTAEMQNLVHRRIYPFLLMVVVLMGILSFQVRQFKRLYEHIKNDK